MKSEEESSLFWRNVLEPSSFSLSLSNYSDLHVMINLLFKYLRIYCSIFITNNNLVDLDVCEIRRPERKVRRKIVNRIVK